MKRIIFACFVILALGVSGYVESRSSRISVPATWEDNGDGSISPIGGKSVAMPTTNFGPYTVATLPAASEVTNHYTTVTDGASSSDCAVGGGTDQVLCRSTGAAWEAVGSSLTPIIKTLSGTESMTAINVRAFYDPGGASRIVQLPPEAEGVVEIINTADASESLTVKDDTGTTTYAILGRYGGAQFVCNGTTWAANIPNYFAGDINVQGYIQLQGGAAYLTHISNNVVISGGQQYDFRPSTGIFLLGTLNKQLSHRIINEAVADEAEKTIATGVAGWGFAQIGDGQEYAHFSFTAAGVVTLINNSANTVGTDTDAKFCIYDAGAGIAIKNRLGSELKIMASVFYGTP